MLSAIRDWYHSLKFNLYIQFPNFPQYLQHRFAPSTQQHHVSSMFSKQQQACPLQLPNNYSPDHIPCGKRPVSVCVYRPEFSSSSSSSKGGFEARYLESGRSLDERWGVVDCESFKPRRKYGRLSISNKKLSGYSRLDSELVTEAGQNLIITIRSKL